MITKEYVLEKCKEVHKDKYEYIDIKDLKNVNEKITYICKKHNITHSQTFHNHIQGKGCPECAKEIRRESRLIKKEEFIKQASKVHNIKNYDFEKTNFNERDEKGRMRIFCREHGYFNIRPNHFLKGIGCQYCKERKKKDEKVREELQRIHPDLDFSKTYYSQRDKDNKVVVICPEHGVFKSNYYNLKNGEGCYKCSLKKSGYKRRLTNEEIIKRGEEKYGKGTFMYDKIDTLNRENDRIVIICPIHGEFSVNIYNFMYGKIQCPKCHTFKLEEKIKAALEKENIKFEQQKTFEWLVYKKNMYLDFYLPEYGIMIECQGKQHFEPIKKWGGDEYYKTVVNRDFHKKTLCELHSVKCLYFMEHKYIKHDNEFSSVKKIISYIKNINVV